MKSSSVARTGMAGIALAGVVAAWSGVEADQPGGATTVDATGKNAFSFSAANLNDEERARFAIGNSFFKRNWVEAPASTGARDGLGPHFMARSCGACHALDGRGAPPQIRNGISVEQPLGLLLRISIPGAADPHAGVRPDPTYGDQLNVAAIQGVRPEGRVVVRERAVPGRFADGTRYTLRAPTYAIVAPTYGPLAPQLMISPRIAPQIIGMGLLEAIPETEIVANAQQQGSAPGPIKGQPNRVWDVMARRELIGRFGWKASAGSVAHQTAAAFLGDIGITSTLLPNEACTPAQTDCLAAPRGGKNGPEIDDIAFENVVFYTATTAPPARRNPHDRQVVAGQALFERAQCAVCHRPSYVTGKGPFPRLTSKALANQKIFPYTDLLLHDMGDGLADGRPDFQANGRQWKTPPLWGLGLLRAVNGHQRLLHDGRADGVLEAILWHGGEAEVSRKQVLNMKKHEREALVKFVESL